MPAAKDRLLHPRPARAPLALLAAALALAAAPLAACTPPYPFNIALTMSVSVPGGGATVPGSRGRIVFTAWQVPGSNRPGAFEIRQEALDPEAPGWPPIRLTPAPGADCTVVEAQYPIGGGQVRRYQVVEAPRIRDAIWPRACHVDFEVLPGAVAGQALRYTLEPVDFCAWDSDRSDNHADFVFGTPTPPAAPAQPVPLAAWPLALLVLAILALVRFARLRGVQARD